MATKTLDHPVATIKGGRVVPFAPLRLVPKTQKQAVCSQTVAMLQALLDEALSGRCIGVAVVASVLDRGFIVDVAGELKANPTFARGTVAALDDKLRQLALETRARSR